MRSPEAVNLIGLSGYAQSGKDSTGLVLVEEYGFTRFAFADALKQVLYDLNPLVTCPTGYTVQVLDLADVVDDRGWEWAKANTNAREYLQRLGVAVREHVDPDAWVNAVLRQVEPGSKVVITDVRFPNEWKAIRDAGGQVWRVTRAGHQPPNDHISEHALDGYEFDWQLAMPDYHDDLDALHAAIKDQAGSILSIGVS